MLHAVIMAGGSGTRFWPASRKSLPKQFLTVSGERSLIQSALDRVQPVIPAARVWVVTNQRHADQTRAQLPGIAPEHLLLEPCARNTAPCVALAAMCLLEEDPEAVMLVTPADQVIDDVPAFVRDVQRAEQIVRDDPRQLVLFGIPPTYPATGFGYIERGESRPAGGFAVKSFREKPDRATAETYLRSGTFLWNCGIFVWSAKRILECLSQHEPGIVESLAPLCSCFRQPDWETQLAERFPAAKAISIDYAVLEREQTISVVDATFGWDDVGGWEAVGRLTKHDDRDNATAGPFIGVGTSGCIIKTSPDHLIATLGVENLIIVHTPDATLVARRGDDEALRELISRIESDGLGKYL